MPELSTKIHFHIEVRASKKKVWDCWTTPEHIKIWYPSSEDWYCSYLESNLCIGGKYEIALNTKDGTQSIENRGYFNKVSYTDGILCYSVSSRVQVHIKFEKRWRKTRLKIELECKNLSSEVVYRSAWKERLDRFKEYVEG